MQMGKRRSGHHKHEKSTKSIADTITTITFIGLIIIWGMLPVRIIMESRKTQNNDSAQDDSATQ
jgi:hypothetical protein